MFVARVVVSGSRRESWSVVGEDGLVVGPAERFLSFLTDSGRSPNTVKAYAHDLRDWFEFLTGRGLDWTTVTVEDVAAFVAWLRLPRPARGAAVAVLPVGEHCCARRSTASSPRSGRCTSTRAGRGRGACLIERVAARGPSRRGSLVPASRE